MVALVDKLLARTMFWTGDGTLTATVPKLRAAVCETVATNAESAVGPPDKMPGAVAVQVMNSDLDPVEVADTMIGRLIA
jgi:hypothetical protein